MTYLKAIPQVGSIEDRPELVRDMLDDPDDLAILSGDWRRLSAAMIAEGVETAEHGAMLLQLGCKEA